VEAQSTVGRLGVVSRFVKGGWSRFPSVVAGSLLLLVSASCIQSTPSPSPSASSSGSSSVAGPMGAIEQPDECTRVAAPKVKISGFAFDRGARVGTGVDKVTLYA